MQEPWLDEGISEFAAAYFFGTFHSYTSTKPVNSSGFDSRTFRLRSPAATRPHTTRPSTSSRPRSSTAFARGWATRRSSPGFATCSARTGTDADRRRVLRHDGSPQGIDDVHAPVHRPLAPGAPWTGPATGARCRPIPGQICARGETWATSADRDRGQTPTMTGRWPRNEALRGVGPGPTFTA